jgi:spermidine/putrescine transport system permease protein
MTTALPSLLENRGKASLSPAFLSIPSLVLLGVGFFLPLCVILLYSFATPRSFELLRSFTLVNYSELIRTENSIWRSFIWSNGLALATCCLLFLFTYPIAHGLCRVFSHWAGLVTNLFIFPLFISENVRLHGWVLFFIKDGVLNGTIEALGWQGGLEVLYQPGMILAGMIYTHFPFMLFPVTLGLAMVPRDLCDAAADLGANRWQIWREVELPIALPGILVGMLLTFVLAFGALTEARILGGQSVIVIAHDVEHAFTYAQNWPLGSALSVLLTLWIGGLVMAIFSKVDLDRILGKKEI